MIDYDDSYLKDTQDRAEQLKMEHSERNNMLQEMNNMFLMKWNDEDRVRRAMENVKLTKSPDARNALIGAMRLLIATDPMFTVPREYNRIGTNRVSDKIEKAAGALWKAAGRARKRPIHYDVVLSSLLHSEMFIAITKTSDMVGWAKGGNKAALRKAEAIAMQTPYVFDVWPAETCYPEIGDYGLTSLYRETATNKGKLLDTFGKDAESMFGEDSRNEVVTLCQWWDYEYRIAWISGNTRPLLMEKHGLDFIPVVQQLGEGSMLFDLPEEQRQPFLYTLWKSGLWERQNLSLTVWYTTLFALGANPLYYERVALPGVHLDVDHTIPGGRVTLGPGEDYGQIQHQPANPLLLEGMSIAGQKIQESTIYGQTLGAPLGGNAPYSMVALLHQAGRLPLVVPQKTAGYAIAEATKIALAWWKRDGHEYELPSALSEIELTEIPDQYELECALDVALPQDNLQAANVASILNKAGAVSMQWIRENVLNIAQSQEMDKQIWREQASGMMFQQFMQEQIAQAQAAAQQQMQQQMQPGGPGGPGGPMPGGPGGPMEQGGPGLQGGLPPEMMGQQGPEMMGGGSPMVGPMNG